MGIMSINARYSRNDLFEDMSYNLVFRPGLVCIVACVPGIRKYEITFQYEYYMYVYFIFTHNNVHVMCNNNNY